MLPYSIFYSGVPWVTVTYTNIIFLSSLLLLTPVTLFYTPNTGYNHFFDTYIQALYNNNSFVHFVVIAEEGIDAVADAEATILSTLNTWGSALSYGKLILLVFQQYVRCFRW